MVAFGACSVVPIYQTPDGLRWVPFENFDTLYQSTRLSADEADHLEWAAKILKDTVDELNGKWDNDGCRRNCDTISRAVDVIHRILESR